jgi:hypothetical protein
MFLRHAGMIELRAFSSSSMIVSLGRLESWVFSRALFGPLELAFPGMLAF